MKTKIKLRIEASDLKEYLSESFYSSQLNKLEIEISDVACKPYEIIVELNGYPDTLWAFLEFYGLSTEEISELYPNL